METNAETKIVAPDLDANSVMKALVMSYVRKGLTVLATYLMTKGWGAELGQTLAGSSEAIAGGLVLLVSAYLSHRNAKQVTAKIAAAKQAVVVADVAASNAQVDTAMAQLETAATKDLLATAKQATTDATAVAVSANQQAIQAIVTSDAAVADLAKANQVNTDLKNDRPEGK